jgi:hypothetical protein
MNPNVSPQLAMLSTMAENKFLGVMNKTILGKMKGDKNVNDDSVYYRYRTGADGNRYSYGWINKMLSLGKEPELIKLGLKDAKDEIYQPFRFEGNEAKPADILTSISNETRERFGIRKGEDVTDMFTIHFVDGTFINTENHTPESLAALLKDIKVEDVDVESSPLFRETSKEGKDFTVSEEVTLEMLKPYNDQVRKMVGYWKNLNESLNGFSMRIPFGDIPFGKPVRIRSFIDDYGSVEIGNGDWNNKDDKDLDGDTQFTYYPQSVRTADGKENNNILQAILSMYNNIGNKDLVFHESDLKEYGEDESKVLNTKAGVDNLIYNYNKIVSGKNCIGIEANFMTVYKALFRAVKDNPEILGKLKIPENGAEVSHQIGAILQMALME